MSIDIADKLGVKISYNNKNSSGFICHGDDYSYVLTAKHSICKSSPNDCKFKHKKCDTCVFSGVAKTKVSICKPDTDTFPLCKVKDVLLSPKKDVAILVLNKKSHIDLKTKELPSTKIINTANYNSSHKFVSCGYPAINEHQSVQPLHYNNFSLFRNEKICLQIINDTLTALEDPKNGLSGNSGAGIILNSSSCVGLLGLYTDTGDYGICYGDIVDFSINELLTSSGYVPLEMEEDLSNNFKALIQSDFMECFVRMECDLNLDKNRIVNLYRLCLDGKKYNYVKIGERLIDCIPSFSLSRKQLMRCRERNAFGKATLSAIRNFLKIERKTKISEMLLQGFLESYLHAPKLYSFDKINNAGFHGAHVKFNKNRNVELIHSAAFISNSLSDGVSYAIDVILKAFPELRSLDGLLGNTFLETNFTEDECQILASLLIPGESSYSQGYEDRLAIFIGYNHKIEESLIYENASRFPSLLEQKIILNVQQALEYRKEEINKLSIVNATIDCFFVPFDDVNKFNDEFIESLKNEED
ncbi:Uncharacterised protein [Klebsiella pneumoniae]|uniref:Hachiman antiphage defense system protein HamA n=1 Tax=Klebsiella pneumoniae TaxID=573 RepID=UPI000E2BC9FD|nr:Hachiman antiphage defense system protein HamA [Klebsiella pneumoniae]SYC46169.1 Uncharacterised protein [Klebsiella pneumoniae]